MVHQALLNAMLLTLSVNANAVAFHWLGEIEREAKALHSEDAETRLEAIQHLAEYDPAYTTRHLLRALTDSEFSVRRAAAHVLAQHGVTAAVEPLLDWLAESEPSVKSTAAKALGTLRHPRSVPTLVRTLSDPAPSVRQAVILALGNIGSPTVIVPLLGRLDDPKLAVRRAAIEQLGRLGDRRAVIPLIGAFSDSSIEVRVAAINAIDELDDPRAIRALERRVRDPVARVREAVVTALGNLGAIGAAQQLIREFNAARTDETYRTTVAYALGKLGRAGNRPSLDALIAGLSGTKNARETSRAALAMAGVAAVPALIAYLNSAATGAPTVAVQLLGDAGDASATATLLAELERDRVKRDDVLAALGRCGDVQALVPVLALVGDPAPSVRISAMRALRPLLAPSAADVLASVLADSEPELRTLAAEYLGMLRSRAAVPALIAAATLGIPQRLRANALTALGLIRDERALDILLKVVRDGPASLRRDAADALVQLYSLNAVTPLLDIVRSGLPDARVQAVRALGGILRNRPLKRARRVLLAASRAAFPPLRAAAIAALGATGDVAAVQSLIHLLTKGTLDQRRAAATALGHVKGNAAKHALIAALSSHQDAIAAAAAWGLATRVTPKVAASLRTATRRLGWATSINATAALARGATAKDVPTLSNLLYHTNRFVRANAARALVALPLSGARPRIELLLNDKSPSVRAGAALALTGVSESAELLAQTAVSDESELVRKVSAIARIGSYTPTARTEWRAFYVAHPPPSNTPVPNVDYIVIASDGLVTAHKTDANGDWLEHAFPPGDVVVVPRTGASGY